LGFCKKDFEFNQTIEEENKIAIQFWIDHYCESPQAAEEMKLALLGPYTIGIARRKTWNVLRVSVRNKLIVTEQLIKLGKKNV